MKARPTTCFLLAVAGSLLLSSRTGLAVTPTESELADAARWTTAKFKADVEPPFSFNYGGKPFAELGWKPVHASRNVEAQRTEHTLTYTDDQSGLRVRCVAVEYHDFPTVEWTLDFTNRGTNDTPILADSFNGDYAGYVIPAKYYALDGYEPRTMSFFGPQLPEGFMAVLGDLTAALADP